jgi:hypothetical protein
MNQINLIVHLPSNAAWSDADRVGYLISLLKGPALDCVSPLLESEDQSITSWVLFKEKFRVFDDPDRERTAEIRLESIKQGRRSASVYAAEFRKIAIDTAWNDEAKIHRFRVGLSEEVKDDLARAPVPTGLEDLIATAIRIDSRLSERRQERAGRGDRFRGPVSVQPVPTTEDPMVIDAINLKEQRNHRLVNGLCLYCGASGHRIADCTARKSGNGTGRQA